MGNQRFDQILRVQAERPELATSWERQRQTARELCRRFDAGSDTQLLADEVGMGKSYVALAVIANFVLHDAQETRKALLVTPPSAVLRSKWEQEIRSFSGNYLHIGGGSGLKPLAVKSFWDLVANLHDHKNEKVLRIGGTTYRCILLYLWRWAVRKKWLSNKNTRWGALGDLDDSAAEVMAFASDYSIAAFEAFLEHANAQGNNSLRAMLTPGGLLYTDRSAAAAKIKSLFKVFAAHQDDHEPNVFILGMNALRTPNRNNTQNQQFATFVLSVLLKGRHEATRHAIVKALKKTNILLSDVGSQTLDALASVDLYRTRDCIAAVLSEDEGIRCTWNAIVRNPAAEGDNGIRDFFAKLLNRTISRKLGESGIHLVVVDEVHNWKSGAHGAKDFRKNFADVIPSKLLMSATPFQLAEGEMRTVFDFAVRQGGTTQQVLERMFDGSSLVDRCLDANQGFQAAWRDLPASDAEWLSRQASIDRDATQITRCLTAVRQEPASSPQLSKFCEKAVAYRTAVDALLNEQRKIMIRHVKPRDRRRFHAGKDFMHSRSKRPALYRVEGRFSPGDAFMNYLAMRLDQLIRAEGRDDNERPAHAHLTRGMSSSKAAFEESRRRKAVPGQVVSQAVKDYMALFDSALAGTDHPKVAATVALALRNYMQGKKTLIFCERVATVREIASTLRRAIEASLGDEPAEVVDAKKTIPRRYLFADIQWYRAWRRRSGARVDPTDPQVRAAAIAFVRARMQSIGVTERRVLRLLDLWFLNAESKQPGVEPSAAHRLFAALASALDSGDAHIAQQVLKVSTDQETDEDSLAQSIEDVFDRGFLTGVNLWVDPDSAAFEHALWRLVESEAAGIMPDHGPPSPDNLLAFYGLLTGPHGLQTGLRRVALRADLLRRALPPQSGGHEDGMQAVFRGVREDRGGGESTWRKLVRFLQNLTEANGTINPIDKTNTRRRSLWRGVELRDESLVVEIHGQTDADQRIQWCAAFNSPLAPDVLVCTAIGSEGIDLHKECAEIIHHDLPWNPARLEQRTGRIDRVGSLAESRIPGENFIDIGIPFLAHNYDQFQYDKLLSRAQVFEVLLGKPDFELAIDEERYDVAAEQDIVGVNEIDAEQDATTDEAMPVLPDGLVEWLRVDLSLESSLVSRQAIGNA